MLVEREFVCVVQKDFVRNAKVSQVSRKKSKVSDLLGASKMSRFRPTCHWKSTLEKKIFFFKAEISKKINLLEIENRRRIRNLRIEIRRKTFFPLVFDEGKFSNHILPNRFRSSTIFNIARKCLMRHVWAIEILCWFRIC
jgi:hypothetical protein